MKEPKIPQTAQLVLRELRTEGIEPSDREIVWLYQLGHKMLHGVSDKELWNYTGRMVGNVMLGPLSLGAKLWLAEDASVWFEHDDAMMAMCLLYAMAHARRCDGAAFKFHHAKHCRKRVKRWARTISATESQLMGAIAELIEDVEPDEDKNDPHYIEKALMLAPAIGLLCNVFGFDAQYVLWGMPAELVQNLQREAIAIESARAGVEPDKKDDPSTKAHLELIKAGQLIRIRYWARNRKAQIYG